MPLTVIVSGPIMNDSTPGGSIITARYVSLSTAPAGATVLSIYTPSEAVEVTVTIISDCLGEPSLKVFTPGLNRNVTPAGTLSSQLAESVTGCAKLDGIISTGIIATASPFWRFFIIMMGDG